VAPFPWIKVTRTDFEPQIRDPERNGLDFEFILSIKLCFLPSWHCPAVPLLSISGYVIFGQNHNERISYSFIDLCPHFWGYWGGGGVV
jgi:hypothetical protein